MPIPTSNANTKACISDHKSDCMYTMIGRPTWKLNPISDTVTIPIPINITFNRILPDDIFHNSLIDRETIFARVQTISRNQVNKLTMISPIFAIHLPSISPFPVIGTNSCASLCHHQRDFAWT